MFTKLFKMVRKEEKGPGMVEYSLIIGLVAVAVVTVLGLMSGRIQAMFTSIVTALGG
ncbi:MAG: Flp family type IVb pilin [Clostridiales bacterium]|nr:Flp family type IVb pilin [Clostridiales bacterium]